MRVCIRNTKNREIYDLIYSYEDGCTAHELSKRTGKGISEIVGILRKLYLAGRVMKAGTDRDNDNIIWRAI